MEKKHVYYKNQRTVINRGNEIAPDHLPQDGLMAACYRIEGIDTFYWGLVIMEEGNIVDNFNIDTPNRWSHEPLKKDIDNLHFFKPTSAEIEIWSSYVRARYCEMRMKAHTAEVMAYEQSRLCQLVKRVATLFNCWPKD